MGKQIDKTSVGQHHTVAQGEYNVYEGEDKLSRLDHEFTKEVDLNMCSCCVRFSNLGCSKKWLGFSQGIGGLNFFFFHLWG